MQGSGQPPASDPELALSRVAGVMRTFFARLSDPAMLPELPKLQARPAARCRACLCCLLRGAARAGPGLQLVHTLQTGAASPSPQHGDPSCSVSGMPVHCACPHLGLASACFTTGLRPWPGTCTCNSHACIPPPPFPSRPTQVPRLRAQAVQRALQSLADTYAAGKHAA